MPLTGYRNEEQNSKSGHYTLPNRSSIGVHSRVNVLISNRVRDKTTRLLEEAYIKVLETSVKLYTDPDYFGAEVVNDTKLKDLPIKDIPLNDLTGYEPDSKMDQKEAKANVKKIMNGLNKGDDIPPILVRKWKNGYQVLDGHHRFYAYKQLKRKTIPAKIVPDKDIETVGKDAN